MKIQYIANHPSGKVGDIAEVGDQFANYLILRKKAVKYEEVVATKEEKAPKKTKAK